MLLPLTAVFLIVFVLLFAGLMLGSSAASEVERMKSRFARLERGGSGGLSSSAPLETTAGLLKQEPRAAGRVSRMLGRFDFSTRLAVLSAQAAKPVTPARFLLHSLLAGALAALASLLLVPSAVIALPVALAGLYVPVLHLQLGRRRRLAAFDKALPDLIDMMARSLRAGHALVAAISIVAEQAAEPARNEFAEVFRQQNFGLPLREALSQLLARVPSQDLRVLVTGILVQKETGGNLVQILDRTAAVTRERLRLKGEIRVHTAQGRMTAWILCLLPVVMLLFINLINPGYSHPLTDTPFGRKLLLAGVALLAAGTLFIRRIVNGIEI